MGRALNLWGVIQTPRKIFPSKNMETYHEFHDNLYEMAAKVILIYPSLKNCPILSYYIIMWHLNVDWIYAGWSNFLQLYPNNKCSKC